MSISYFASTTTRSSPAAALAAPASPYESKWKGNPDSSDESNRHHSAPADLASSSALPLNRFAAEEFRTAGQPLSQELPPFPFPHAAVKECARLTSRPQRSGTSPSLDSDSSVVVSSQSDEDGVEVVPKPKSSSDVGLRQQHYTVLTSLLHRCLMEKDYMRASRAWGILLRLEVHGHPLDIRAQERWGVGAELLLNGNTNNEARPSLENLMRAKDYYERLILQYPYRKHSPEAVSSLTFYPVMFGLWIYSIQSRYKFAVEESAVRAKGDDDPEATHISENEPEESVSSTSSARTAVQTEACRIAVEQANEVVKKLGELLISPPYSDHSGLWKIQGMLYLWLSQLLDRKPKEGRQERQKALRKAYEAFSRALKEGGTIDTRTRETVGL
ncbi:MAG: hypothetical protein LQ339_001326 [Xanthoria mediterranea]|nr:MAG: hypothetical protein LQ339_001326 [Xanthoria mediterranea]